MRGRPFRSTAHLATDAQRAYLRRLVEQAFARRVDITAARLGLDTRRGVESEHLTREHASAAIDALRAALGVGR